MNIAFCTMEQMDNREKNSVGSSRIRARWLWEVWDSLYPETHAEPFSIGRKYDVMIFQKVYWKPMLELFEGIKILDLCDPDWLERSEVMDYVRRCDYCTTSTEALAEYIRKFVDIPVKHIPDRIYKKEHIPRGKHHDRAKKICWFGYSHNQHYLNQTLDLLNEKKLELVVISNQPYTAPTGMNFFNVTNEVWSYPSVHEGIARCDLYLSPERSDERGKFKSNNKELTAMALGVPVVRSADDLDRLMDGDERNKQQALDFKEIDDNWLVEYSVKEMKEVIDECYKAKEKNMDSIQ